MRLLYEKVPYRISESIRAVSHVTSQISCPYHYHPELELVWIQKSTGRFSIGDYQGAFREGDLFFIGSNVPHVFYNTEEHQAKKEAAQTIVIQFSDRFLGEQIWKTPELLNISKTIQLSKKGIQFSGKKKESVFKSIKKLLKAHNADRVILLLQILQEWSRPENQQILNNLLKSKNLIDPQEPKIQKILTYLSNHIEKRISLSELSQQVHMAPSSLSRLFRQKMGISLVDYLNTQRIAHSCQLLATSELTISEICFNVGFENLSNFNRQFLKRKQCSPRDFRGFYKNKIKHASHYPSETLYI